MATKQQKRLLEEALGTAAHVRAGDLIDALAAAGYPDGMYRVKDGQVWILLPEEGIRRLLALAAEASSYEADRDARLARERAHDEVVEAVAQAHLDRIEGGIAGAVRALRAGVVFEDAAGCIAWSLPAGITRDEVIEAVRRLLHEADSAVPRDDEAAP